MSGNDGMVDQKLCDQRYNELKGKYEFLLTETRKTNDRVEEGFDKVYARIEKAEDAIRTGMVKVLMRVIAILGPAFIAVCSFIVYAYVTGNLKIGGK